MLLAVDQLEELFTACRSDAERGAFADTLARAAADPGGRAVVVVALRADYYGRFATYPALARLLGANNVLVGPMPASELRRVVELPASRVGLRVEPELADALVSDVEGEPGAMPLLSTALLELWQKRQGNALTLAAYRESDGVHGAVARLAEGTYAHIPDGQKQLVRAIMLRLVGEGEGDAVVRRRAPLAELDLESNADADACSRRWPTAGSSPCPKEASRSPTRPCCANGRACATGSTRTRKGAGYAATSPTRRADWDAAGRDPGELYRGARLAAALDWTADHSLDVNELERAFVTESREASEQETRRVRHINRRLRILLVGAAVLLAAAVAGGMFAAIQRSQARDAETAQLVQRLGAQALVQEHLDLSLLLARQAVAITSSPQTRGYLLAALQRSPAAVGIMHGPGDFMRSIALSPDGTTLAVYAGGVLLFDARTYAQIGSRFATSSSADGSLAYSPDGRVLAIGEDQLIRTVDARTHEQLAKTVVSGAASHVMFTSDGSRIVAVVTPGRSDDLGTANAEILTVDAATMEQVGATVTPDAFVGAYVGFYYASPQFAFTSRERAVLTASEAGELAWWDLRTGRKTRSERVATGLHALAVSPDGLTAVVGVDRGLQFVDLRSGSVRTAVGDLTGNPNWVLFSPDSKTVVSTGLDGTVTLWDVASATAAEALHGHSSSVQQPVFSPDGATLYTVSHDGKAIAWNIGGDRRLARPFTFTDDRTFSSTGYDGHPGEFSPDGRLIAVGLKRNGVTLRDARTLKRVGAPLLQTGGEVKNLAFSADGRLLAAVADNGSLTLWDVPSRSRLHGIMNRRGGGGIRPGVGFSADGSTLVTSSYLGVMLWDVATGDGVGILGTTGPASDLAFSTDGALVAFARGDAAPGGAEVWDFAHRTLIFTADGLADDSWDLSVALSPNSRLLAVGGFGKTVRLWDIISGKLVHVLEQGGNGAFTLEFSPDGRTLAVSGFEPVASLWDVATGNADRAPTQRRRPQDDDRSLPGRAQAARDARQRHGGRLGCRPRVLGATRLRDRQAHADPRRVEAVPSGTALRAGLRNLNALRRESTR